MARCYRCNACQSMWDMKDCTRCGEPGPDKRTSQQIVEDTMEILETLLLDTDFDDTDLEEYTFGYDESEDD